MEREAKKIRGEMEEGKKIKGCIRWVHVRRFVCVSVH